jgi:MFS superfamily sulfate permease-like transporter
LAEHDSPLVTRRRWFPFSAFEGWTPAFLGSDLAAGVTLAAVTIPEQMATAKLGGFEPQIGFYALIGATVGFAALGSSRLLAAGADSTITPIFAGSLAVLAAGSTGAQASVAMTLALLVGAMLIVGGVLRLGWVANLLSTPVITGFLAGIAVHIVVSQLPSFFGIPKASGDLMTQAWSIVRNLSTINAFTTAIGVGVLAAVLVAEHISPRVPGALIGVVVAMLVVLAFDLESRGVAVIGQLPGGLPHPAAPALDDLLQLVPLALIITLVIAVQTATVSKSFHTAAGNEPDIDRDFLGIGAGNIAAALCGGFPIDASPPRTAVVAEAGGKSQLAALVAAALVFALVLWGGSLLAAVPEAALAGVLLFVAYRIVHIDIIMKTAREAPIECLLVLLTAAAIIVLPIQTGVAVGIALSLLHGVQMSMRSRPVELRRLPGSTVWWPPETAAQGQDGEGQNGERQDGVAVIGFHAPLLFTNADSFKRAMIAMIDAHARPLRLVVLEASGIADIDFTAAEALRQVIDHCRAADIQFALARLESVRAQRALARLDVLAVLGENNVFHSVDEAVRALAPRS